MLFPTSEFSDIMLQLKSAIHDCGIYTTGMKILKISFFFLSIESIYHIPLHMALIGRDGRKKNYKNLTFILQLETQKIEKSK